MATDEPFEPIVVTFSMLEVTPRFSWGKVPNSVVFDERFRSFTANTKEEFYQIMAEIDSFWHWNEKDKAAFEEMLAQK